MKISCFILFILSKKTKSELTSNLPKLFLSPMRNCLFIFLIFSLISCSKKEAESPTETSELITISEGEFIMGSNEGTGDEKPVRKIFLESYKIDKYAVSNEQYKKFADSTGYSMPKKWVIKGFDKSKAKYPVVLVNFEDATAYCEWLGLRLPTEEEWEKAARGTDGRKYPWGDTFDKSKLNTSKQGVVGTIPVNSNDSSVSPYGLHNMAGNVWEWTSGIGQNPERRVTKGGSWGLSHRFSRTFSRVDYHIKDKTNNIGFRCAG